MTYSPADLTKIITAISDGCDHPLAALRVWSVLQLNGPNADVTYDRTQLADLAGTSVGSVSRVITELETVGALQRVAQSRGVRQIAVRLKRFW